MASADELKAKGNKAFGEGKNEEAVNWFTSAIAVAPENHVLYSNRSAAYAAQEIWGRALDDANKTVELNPNWAKGYSRKGAALHGKGDIQGAIDAYKKGLEVDPKNENLTKSLAELQRPAGGGIFGGGGAGGRGGDVFGKLFGPDVFAKIQMNPTISGYLDEEDYVNMIKLIQKNPSSLQMFLSDKRIQATFGALTGINLSSMGGEDDDDTTWKAPPKKEDKPTQKPKEEEEEVEMSAEELEAKDRMDRSAAEKDKGNAHYKNKEFDKALEFYDKALEIAPENVTCRTNKAAVYFEQGEYERCIEECDRAVDEGRQYRTDMKNIGKALARKGAAYHKRTMYTEAIQAYKSSLMEHRCADTLNKLQKVEKEKKQAEIDAYLDPEKALEAKQRGNEFFGKDDYPAALKEYNEAIRRNPKDHTFYSNRAAAYMKLGEYSAALVDCDKCLEIEPTFVKVVVRKAQIYYFRKEYHKALQYYEEALKQQPENEECRNGINKTLSMIQSAQSSGEVDEDRVQKAMADPEIQNILRDPMMSQILTDLSQDPAAARAHMKDPEVMNKINKLIAAGVISTRNR